MIENFSKWKCDLCLVEAQTSAANVYPSGNWVKMKPITNNALYVVCVCGDCVNMLIQEDSRIYCTKQI